MRRKPKKSQIPKQETIVVKIDPMQLKTGIVLPKVKYEVLATVEEEQVFHGMVLPIPRVLLYYLNRHELMVVATIIEKTNETGICASTLKDMSTKLKVSVPSLSNCLFSLRKVGLLLEEPNGKRGGGRLRKLNYEAIQHLNDLVEGEDPGIYTRIRKATRKIDITHLTKEDINKAYDNKVLQPDHDPAEEEEYD